ncbi:hydroxypyruvate isomerase family protein [Jannaschia donghaensis]|uniref:Hydroxypyruvate isomerase n=1 Tax=Jannaschia donghaensis TaxID=420998 RepID=A0A0M6YJE5_9RHOB|nr:TIM barrel protein [Jannaschia donghaensis]CTQ49397.1 Hydroxypyruvate isomerase [Jannaschia donghaensis]
MKFSANLGFLWTELSLPDAIRAARDAGFDAVEFHWPYDTPAEDVLAALKDTGLPALGVNTVKGEGNGLSALPGREAEARVAIDQAIDYARAIGSGAVHVMAGFAEGQAAHDAFVANLRYACDRAPDLITLIEPLNHHDAPGYFLTTSAQARQVIEDVHRGTCKLMFDCYHLQIMGGDLTRQLSACKDVIGHIQFASVPDRGRPDAGELSYDHVFAVIETMGWDVPLGAEYKPGGDTGATLGWMDRYA